MKKTMTFLFLTFALHAVVAQPVLQWQSCLGGQANELGYGLIQTYDGGYLSGSITQSNSGNVSGNHGNYDFWIVKLNASGAVQWQKCLGGTDEDNLIDFRQTTDSGFVFTGYIRSNDGDVSGNHGGDYDAWVVKTDSQGTIQWQKCLGGTGMEIPSIIVQTADGGYILAISTDSDNGDVTAAYGMYDVWVVKLDAGGAIEWEKTIGGTESETPYAVIPANGGGYLVSGVTFSTDNDMITNHGGIDGFVTKLDASGNIEWNKCLGGTQDEYDCVAFYDAAGNILFTGTSYSNDGDVTNNYGMSDSWLVKLDPAGNMIWQKTFGGSDFDEAHVLPFLPIDGYLLAGSSRSSDHDLSVNKGLDDIWICKMDTAGNVEWSKSYGGSENDYIPSVFVHPSGGFFISCITYSNNGDVTGFHGSPGITSDAWIIRTDSLGDVTWQQCYGGSMDDDLLSVFIDGTDNYLLAGTTSSNNGSVSGNHGSSDVWLVRLSTATGLEETGPAVRLNFYPNPATESRFTVRCAGAEIESIEMYNMQGARIYFEEGLSGTEAEVRENLPQGIYLVKVTAGGRVSTGRLVVESR